MGLIPFLVGRYTIRGVSVLLVLLVVLTVSGCSAPDSNVPDGKDGQSSANFGYLAEKMDTTKSVSESNALVANAVRALESGNATLYNSMLTSAVRDPENKYFPRPCPDDNAFIGALKAAKVTEAFPSVVYYETTLDGLKYAFSTIQEGGEWRLVF
jgi:hypothetical protein